MDHRAELRRQQSSHHGEWMGNRSTQEPAPEIIRRSSAFRKFDVTGAMDRLRSSMVGDKQGRREGPLNIGPETLHGSNESDRPSTITVSTDNRRKRRLVGRLSHVAGQIPAIVLIGMFHLMIGIPFGVSYFPIGWRSGGDDSGQDDSDGVEGPFPLPGKNALGIRMFLFSTVVSQIVFTLSSGFKNPIGLNMVENVPFTHALSQHVIAHQGYGIESLSTLFVMFGLASIIVGSVFYVLGKLKLGRIVYYFPTAVLVGCIGGIGLYIAKTGIEVTLDAVFSFDAIASNMDLLGVVLLFEIGLRFLEQITKDENGKPKYSLLSPIYFCLITPIFYAGLLLFQVDVNDAVDAGYFFPSLQDEGNDSSFFQSIFTDDLFDMWRVIDFSVVSWRAIADSIPTLVALTLFSLIHVPINIPAFALSTCVDVDMNKELVAHGYSNMIAGAFAGLQNYLAYTQSVLYARSGGTGKASGFAVAAVTILLFFIGPTIASYIPRCMAGTLLLHVGIDLFLEGVYDSIGKFDSLEYAGIWLIVIVMTFYGMDAAMIAGVSTAITTYVVQNTHYVDPVRGYMSASTLRSSQLTRHPKAREILDDPVIGRGRILVIQLQGHLFFGNMANLTESISRLLSEKGGTIPIVILDFSLVLGIDSSAAQAMAKLKTAMQTHYDVQLSIFVSGSEQGFPCAFDLSAELSAPSIPTRPGHNDVETPPSETTGLLHRVASQEAMESLAYSGSHVTDTLDMALIYAENAIIYTEDPSLLSDDVGASGRELGLSKDSSLLEEREAALTYLKNLSPGTVDDNSVELLFLKFDRQVFSKDEFLWHQGSPSTCAKLLVRGTLVAVLENEAGTNEIILSGNTIGEVGLVEGVLRMSSVKCLSEEAIVYSLSRQSYESLIKSSPHAARLIDLICVRYLSARVQHVSNRIFETRCLPI